MISGIQTLRNNLLLPAITPKSRTYLRRMLPNWSRYTGTANGYIEDPDLIFVDPYYDAKQDVSGTYAATYGGWNKPIPGDSAHNGSTLEDYTHIVRIQTPASLGDTSHQNYINIFRVDSTTDTDQFITPDVEIVEFTDATRPKLYTRPGITFSDGIFSYYYISIEGSICYSWGSSTGSSFTTPGTVISSTDNYANVVGATVAPVGWKQFFVYYMLPDDRRMYLDFYDTDSYTIQGEVLGYNYDEDVHWATTHWFDAVEFASGGYLLTVNFSKFGASKAFRVYEDTVSNALPILPVDDIDWTGTCGVVSLSVVTGGEYDDLWRIYAVAQQRFLDGDGNYSRALWTLLWTDDGIHWAQSKYHAL